MSSVEVVPGQSFKETSGSEVKTKVRVFFYDPKQVSTDAIVNGKQCSKNRTAYLSQLFEWNGKRWTPCCLLFEAETDAPC
jgi:hypothetical protein